MLVKNYRQKDIIHELVLNKNTVNQWMTFVREVMEEWAAHSSEQLGGEGDIVEIDESKFWKMKFHKGHYVEGKWVFGGKKDLLRKYLWFLLIKESEEH